MLQLEIRDVPDLAARSSRSLCQPWSSRRRTRRRLPGTLAPLDIGSACAMGAVLARARSSHEVVGQGAVPVPQPRRGVAGVSGTIRINCPAFACTALALGDIEGSDLNAWRCQAVRAPGENRTVANRACLPRESTLGHDGVDRTARSRLPRNRSNSLTRADSAATRGDPLAVDAAKQQNQRRILSFTGH